jgi:hypothetical protein
MPQSRTRSRAAMRSKYRKPKRRRSGSTAWLVATLTIVLVFALVLVLTVVDRQGNSAGANTRPHYADSATGTPGDHWHTYLGVDICGEWLDPMPQFDAVYDNPNIQPGIHSHGDGLIHTHPFQSSEAGTNATIGKFFSYGGWSISSDSIDLGGANSTHPQWAGPASDPKKTTWSAGDTCPFGQYKGEKVEMTWYVDGKEMTGNPADYHQQNGETVAVYFLPKGAEKPFPPNACSAFANISDASIRVLSKRSPCRAATTPTTAPGATSGTSATTDTTAPASTSTP